jgi:hypothetical protein
MTTTIDPLTLFGVNDRDTIRLATEVARRFTEPGLIDESTGDREFDVELLVEKVGTRPTALVGHVHWFRPNRMDIAGSGELWFGVAARIVWITTSTAEGAHTRRFVGRGGTDTLAADQAADETAEAVIRFATGRALR